MPLAERVFNFPNMASFETKSKTGTKTVQKHFGNVSFMTMYTLCNYIFICRAQNIQLSSFNHLGVIYLDFGLDS